MSLKKVMLLGTVSLLSVTLVACGSGNNAKKSEGSKNAGQASGEQIYRASELQEMPSADLSLATDTVSFTALNNVYEGVYRLNLDNKAEPAGAAEEATISEDGKVYTIKLNEKSKWTDGEPVTANDYVYGWQRTVSPETASEYAYLFEPVKNAKEITEGKKDKSELGVKALSDYELEITLENATPYFNYLLAAPTYFPQRKDIVEKFGKDYATSSETAVYNGPFVLANFKGPGTDTEWSYKKNDQYWDADSVKLDEVKVSVVKEAPTAYNLFKDGQLDDVQLTGEIAQQSANDPQLIVEKLAATQYIELNQADEDSPFRNENLRKAIAYSIDRKGLVENILADGSIAPKGLVPADMSKSPENGEDFSAAAGDDISYDVEKAKEHWEKAKKELDIDTLELDILSSDSDSYKKIAEYAQGAIQDTLDGVKVTVSPVPLAVRLDRSNKGEFSTVLGGWIADYADPSSFLDLFKTGVSYNRGKYNNAEYDKLLTAAATTDANDPDKRWTDMVDAEKIIMGDMGVIPLYQVAEAHLRSDKVKDIAFHPAGAKYDYKWAYISE